MKTETYEYRIPQWAVCPLEYGERDGLEPEDERALENFLGRLEDIREEEGAEHYCFVWGEEEPYFSHSNDVDNMAGAVIDAEIVFFKRR